MCVPHVYHYLFSVEDILDSFLSEYRERREQRSRSRATPSDPSPPDPLLYTEGGEFVTPELPCGRELVLNILATWGDKFYVGLTGIEIYTELGEVAEITEV